MMMKSTRNIYFFVLAVIVIPVAVFGITRWVDSSFRRLPVLGPDKHIVSRFSFKDQTGEAITEKDWQGKIVNVRINAVKNHSLYGELVEVESQAWAHNS